MKGAHILLGITGGIAAYKIPQLVRDFVKAGASVRAVMTEAAEKFVTPLTLSALTREEVVVGTFPSGKGVDGAVVTGTWHIALAEWAHCMLIAPATANTIAKLAHGYADNAVTTLALAMRRPVVIAPAMDSDMWKHPATAENIAHVRELGYIVLPPEEGALASGLTGPGRLPARGTLFRSLENILKGGRGDLTGKKVLVTAGPTHEAIDPVRYIGNRSSGKMGFALAAVASERGAQVTLVAGRVSLATPRNVRRIDVESAAEMHSACMKHRRGADAVIMAAAVADFTPRAPSPRKIKKEGAGGLVLELTKTRDILGTLGASHKDSVLVGFALETHNEVANAKKKLKEKHLDFIVVNNPRVFGAETNVVTIISKRGTVERLGKMPKRDVACEILNRVSAVLAGHRSRSRS